MARQIVLNVLQQGIVLLLALLFLKPNHPRKRLVVISSGAFLVNSILLTLPNYYPFFNFTGPGWNWSGKLYATCASTLVYHLLRKDFTTNDFITLDQKPNSVKLNLLLGLFILTVNLVSAWVSSTKQAFSVETLAYQLTMPGVEEELLFRGILLSLLSTIYLKPIVVYRWTIGYPSIWLTALLFGLVHGLRLEKDWSLMMNWAYFGSSFLPGWLFGWMTLRSRSILASTLTHNLANFILVFISMIK